MNPRQLQNTILAILSDAYTGYRPYGTNPPERKNGMLLSTFMQFGLNTGKFEGSRLCRVKRCCPLEMVMLKPLLVRVGGVSSLPQGQML